ncbi:MAG: hypothetical protein RLN62_04095 [Rickettsiales bacterium]
MFSIFKSFFSSPSEDKSSVQDLQSKHELLCRQVYDQGLSVGVMPPLLSLQKDPGCMKAKSFLDCFSERTSINDENANNVVGECCVEVFGPECSTSNT